MSVWVPEVSLAAGETIVFRAPGSMFKARRLIAGRITVTDQRFVYVPNRLDGIFGADPMEFPLTEIVDVRPAPAGREAAIERGAGAARRPQIDIDHAGTTSIVTVKQPETLIAALTKGGQSSDV